MTVSEIFERWQRPSHIQLHAGEMTAAELRSVRAVVKALQAEVTAALSDQAGGWQDISTAPKDKTEIILLVFDHAVSADGWITSRDTLARGGSRWKAVKGFTVPIFLAAGCQYRRPALLPGKILPNHLKRWYF